MGTLTNGPGPGQNYGEMAINGRFYALPKSGKRAKNPIFSKITPKIGQKTDIYLAPKIRISARKSVFSYGNLFFCTETRIAQVVTQILRPTDLVYDFSFPSRVTPVFV